MPAQNLKKEAKSEVYSHIYNKGVENRNLFNDETDYEVFQGFLKDYLTPTSDTESIKKVFTVNGRTFRGVPHQPKNYFNKVDLIAYSLIPDHFHLLARQKLTGSLEKLIRSLCTRYAIYYNKKYARSGSLFQGPYKSVQIKDTSQLLYLTYYFHQVSKEDGGAKTHGHSSYSEYLGIKENPWVNTNVVMSFFNHLKNGTFKGISGYKHFVENYELNQNEIKLLEGISLENDLEDLKKTPPVQSKNESPEKTSINSTSKPRLSIAKFISTATVVFLLLFVLGIRNIRTSTALSNNNISSISPTPQVSGIEDTVIEGTEPKKTLVIKITDGVDSVNIRQQPTTKSDKVGEAKDGDTFEFASKEGEWYEIKLEDGSSAFVSERYAELEGEENN